MRNELCAFILKNPAAATVIEMVMGVDNLRDRQLGQLADFSAHIGGPFSPGRVGDYNPFFGDDNKAVVEKLAVLINTLFQFGHDGLSRVESGFGSVYLAGYQPHTEAQRSNGGDQFFMGIAL
nr:hypothetical protein [Aliamphritea spongicola]